MPASMQVHTAPQTTLLCVFGCLMATCGSTDTNKCSVADSARRFLDTDNDPSEITFSVSMSDLVDIQVLEPYAVGSKRTLLEIEIPPAISSVEIVSVVVYTQ